jgi:plasmid stabilization system protein ParE
MPDGTSDGLAVLDDQLKLELPARPKVLDIANAFQKLFGKAIEYRKAKPQDNARLVGLLVQEIDRAVKLHPEAKGWYDENVKLTMDVMRELDPDIAKPENDFIFKAILAATSDGNKVGPQFQQTWKEYSNWKNTGEISGEFVSGDRIENIQTNLEMLNEMIKDVGWEKTKDFMVQKGTVKELRQALMDVFGWTKKQAQSIGSSELADEVVPFAVVLGPKLGSFFNNLYGDFSSVTMDRWFMRTLGRLTGTQVAPLAASKLREMRNNLRSAVERLTPSQFELLGIKRSDTRGSAIDDTATTIAGRFAKKDLRVEAKRLSAEGQSALEETRKFANALKKGLNPLVEAPVDGTHRRWIRERIAEVQKELRSRGIELENADLQAVLWYLEKELYEKLKYRSKSGESDYASAASSLYQSVAGRPSDVYAGGTGRVRAIGSTGGSEGMGAGQASQAAGPEVGGQRFMPSDTDYLSAVNSGDTAAAQQMVDQAAKAAGYTVGPVFHGSAARFNQFKRAFLGSATGGKSSNEAFFFSTSDKTAKNYASYASEEGPIKELMRKADQAEAKGDWDLYDKLVGQAEELDFGPNAQELRQQRREQSKVYNVYLKGKFLEMDAEGMTPAELSSAKDFKDFDGSLTAALKSANRKGYDGVVFRNLDDAPNLSDPSDHYAIFDPNKIKLSDAVTNDDQGNVIPLSQRFQASSADIRYMPESIQRDIGRNQDFANPPTDTEAIDALSSEKKAKFGAARNIKPGTQVAARIDIPAFLRTGKYVVAVHEPDGAAGGPGKVIGYDTVTRLQNPKFVVKPGVQRIYEGKSAKFPVATVDGKIMADRSIPADLENYVPVGMDPKEHAYFYDKRTDQPVIGGSESVSVGNTVFVKNPVYGDPSQFAFMPSPDSSMPGAYSFTGGYRALPGKSKGSLRIYSPAGSLIGIAASLDEAQRIIRKKARQ